MGHSEHTLDGATLTVTPRSTAVEPCNEKEAQESRTIEVTGLAATTTKDAISNFFENKRRSGGGEIESVDFNSDQATAVITFTKAESKSALKCHTPVCYLNAVYQPCVASLHYTYIKRGSSLNFHSKGPREIAPFYSDFKGFQLN